MTTKMICIKPFKYDGKKLKPGDEFIPVGGRFDHILTDPERRYIRIEQAGTREPVNKPKEAPPKQEGFICSCGREFETDRGLKTHQRYCKEKEKA